MSLKDILIKLKERINKNSTDDFHVILENHELGNQTIYRLHYLNYHNIGEGYGYQDRRGMIDWPFPPFLLPVGMEREDAFKVLSYLTDFIEKRPTIEECSFQSVKTLNNVIDLERFGFKRPDFKPDINEIIDLFTITGRVRRFKESEYYEKYYNWYIENITKEEVEEIYLKCGMKFEDIIFKQENTFNELLETEKILHLNKNRVLLTSKEVSKN